LDSNNSFVTDTTENTSQTQSTHISHSTIILDQNPIRKRYIDDLCRLKADLGKIFKIDTTEAILQDLFDNLSPEKIAHTVAQHFDKQWEKTATPLMKTVGIGSSKMLKLLLKHNININEADTLGRTALYIAAYTNQYECAELLLAYGANLNQTNMYGISPLACAVREEHLDMVKLLLSRLPIIDVKTQEIHCSQQLQVLLRCVLDFQHYLQMVAPSLGERINNAIKENKSFYSVLTKQDIDQLIAGNQKSIVDDLIKVVAEFNRTTAKQNDFVEVI